MTKSAEGIVENAVTYRGVVSPPDYAIQILDYQFKPMQGKELIVKVGTDEWSERTDKDGVFTVARSKADEKCCLADRSDSTTSSSKNEYSENPGPLPVLDLRNRSEGGQGPLAKEDSRKTLVEHLQEMLRHLGYHLVKGRYIPRTERRGNSIDGIFGEMTEKAVKDFQASTADWTGKPLAQDGLVGPLTADALNRAMVGLWYDKYETPTEITGEDRGLISVTESLMKNRGLDL